MTLKLDRTESRLDHPFDLTCSLLVRVNHIVLPVVLSHELGVGVQATPVILVAREDLLDVCIVLAGTLLVCLHPLVGRPLLSLDLLNGLLVD